MNSQIPQPIEAKMQFMEISNANLKSYISILNSGCSSFGVSTR